MTSRPRGDPEGRRPAQRRAHILAEARQVALVLRVLLSSAGFGTAEGEQIERILAEQEKIELQRAYGRIEPRNRFKGQSSQPLIDNRIIDNLYVDESGKSFREPLSQPQFFALGGISMSESESKAYVERADALKLLFFGTTDMTFHEPYMRTHDGPYRFDGDVDRQAEFDAALEELVRNTDFVSFGVGIRKRTFEEQFVKTGIDPYLPTDAYAVAITMLLERYVDYVAVTQKSKSMGRVTFESQGPREDATHQLEYARLLVEGSQWVSEKAFRNWLETGLRFMPKQGSHPLELADMLSRELFEWIRDGCATEPLHWNLFSSKVYVRDDGNMGKFGIKVFPDSDIRELIDVHRKRFGAKVPEKN